MALLTNTSSTLSNINITYSDDDHLTVTADETSSLPLPSPVVESTAVQFGDASASNQIPNSHSPILDSVINQTSANVSQGDNSQQNIGLPAQNQRHSRFHVSSCSEQTSTQVNGGVSGRRRVKFPEDSSLVKGCALPPNPWYNVSLCTTDNLIGSYNNSCLRHGVKPLPKLRDQLMNIKTFGERIGFLNLKGEHLNSRHIETLEEIFRRVQFNVIDLENTHLDDESAIAVLDMVEYYESALHLRLSHNKSVGLRGWMAAARTIRKTPCLESFDIRGCTLGDHGIAALGRSLRMGAFIHTIVLEDCNLSGKGVMILAAALRVSPVVKELFIGDNNLQPIDGTQLGSLLRDNVFINVLDLKNNNLQDIGTAHICDGLAQQSAGTGLKSLILVNNHITPNGMQALASALSRTKTLDSLNLSQNSLTNEGIYILKEGLLKNKSLTRLSLAAIKLSCEGTVALAEYIADSYTVTQLDLRDNDIKTAGLLALSMCLKVHNTVTRLELDQQPKREQAIKDYQVQQRFFLDEIKAQLERNAQAERIKVQKLLEQQSAIVQQEALAKLKRKHESEPNIQQHPASSQLPAKEPSQPSDASTQPTISLPSTQYFDPLGAVAMDETSEPSKGIASIVEQVNIHPAMSDNVQLNVTNTHDPSVEKESDESSHAPLETDELCVSSSSTSESAAVCSQSLAGELTSTASTIKPEITDDAKLIPASCTETSVTNLTVPIKPQTTALEPPNPAGSQSLSETNNSADQRTELTNNITNTNVNKIDPQTQESTIETMIQASETVESLSPIFETSPIITKVGNTDQAVTMTFEQQDTNELNSVTESTVLEDLCSAVSETPTTSNVVTHVAETDTLHPPSLKSLCNDALTEQPLDTGLSAAEKNPDIPAEPNNVQA